VIISFGNATYGGASAINAILFEDYKNEIVYSDKAKAIIQQYNNRLIENRLTVN